ncbi:nucleophile aminohydrolase [Gaertneriomyces semiglobifer]|nr:nucleophile aminohydrolase [Gaertneriomyces semiglobifer]
MLYSTRYTQLYPMSQPPFLAVHAGAGFHHPSNDATYKRLLKRALRAGMQALLVAEREGRLHEAAMNGVCEAVRVLEDSGRTNAGRGSNMTLEGTAECDASIHVSSPSVTTSTTTQSGTCHDSHVGATQFGSIGATPSLRNPILGARCVLQHAAHGIDPVGRVPPMTLVGDGARRFCVERDVEASGELDRRSHERWHRHMRILEMGRKRKRGEDDEIPNANEREEKIRIETLAGKCGEDILVDDMLNDTVGAIAISSDGTIVSGVSSGGISLKFPGRIGEAALFGCGTWSETDTYVFANQKHPEQAELNECKSETEKNKRKVNGQDNGHSNVWIRTEGVGCSVSGTGEQIIETQVARTLSQQLLSKNGTSNSNHINSEDNRAGAEEAPTFDTDSSAHHETIQAFLSRFLTTPLLQNYPERNVGVILVHYQTPSQPSLPHTPVRSSSPMPKANGSPEGHTQSSSNTILSDTASQEDLHRYLYISHTTPSFAVGYMTPSHSPVAYISRAPTVTHTRTYEETALGAPHHPSPGRVVVECRKL